MIEGKRSRSARSTSSTPSCTFATLSVWSTTQWKLTISPPSASRTRTSWIVANEFVLRCDLGQRIVHGRDPFRRGLAPGLIIRLQRLDMGVDLHLRSQFLADRVFEPARDVVRGTERQRSVDLEIEGDREPSFDLVHGDVMHRQRAVARDDHDPFEHGLVVECARFRGYCHLGGRPFGAHGFDDTVLERRHPIERQRAADRNDQVDEQHFTDLAHAQPFDLRPRWECGSRRR